MENKELLIYFLATLDDKDDIQIVNRVDNYINPFESFFTKIDFLYENKDINDIEFYCIIDKIENIEQLKKTISMKIKSNLFDKILAKDYININEVIDEINNSGYENKIERFINLYIKHCIKEKTILYPIYNIYKNFKEDLACIVYSFIEKPQYEKFFNEKIDKVFNVFFEKEAPFMQGKQIMLKSFLLQNLIDRRIITFLPNVNGEGWCALLEGGMKLPINLENINGLKKVNKEDIGMYTSFEIYDILIQSGYAYEKVFFPSSLFEEWMYVFLYALATLNIEYDFESMDKLLKEFFSFLEENICNTIYAENIISKDMYIKIFITLIYKVKEFLSGKEDYGLSKNILYQMRSRYIYLPQIYRLIARHYEREVLSRKISSSFNKEDFTLLLRDLDYGNNNEKGINLEEIANHFIESIEGLVVSGRRVKFENQEIDICCFNISKDVFLWQLGAVILVECKNLKDKVSTKEIRSMIHLMQTKGVNTYILFSKNGVTKDAIKEINKQLIYQSYIIVIDKADLENMIRNDLKPADILREKINELKSIEIML